MTCTDDIGDAGTAEATECGCGRGCPPHSPAAPEPERRGPHGPVMTGDVVDGESVLGFGYEPPPQGTPPGARYDRLLAESDLGSASPPLRPVPAARPPAPGDDRLPHHRLPKTAVVPAARRSRCLPAAVRDLLADGSAPWATVVEPVARRVRAAGHELWLTGGASRELLSEHGREAVRDLDLTGTAPAGRYAELAREALEEDGESYELRTRVSPDSLVCTVYDVGLSTALLEYRGLGQEGFGFPATGTDLAADSRQRDFTVNSILYDFERHLVIDPSGRGLSDLAVPGRALTPANRSSDPLIRSELVLRAVKFLVRWEAEGPVDTRELCAWTAEFPDDLAGAVRERGDTAWQRLCALHHECLGTVQAERQSAAARSLGPSVERLFEALLGSRA
ncbi:hypothetical protein D0Z67_25050 [Streptomyces seoulensis]|uniref:Poly A polymerase head domain-containing protein n=1 Tax=Streptomyces seoulensis TaxID=73044 RepID=A0A4P6U041_STRSO|nr:hypothetical protein [Streptomyces seoulensis]QBJ93229.1 hypothetical protein D0Z67_25050 [Streptomyces seoulensis]